MSVPLAYNFRSLLARRTTTFATAGGIALVVFVLSASMMLARGIEQTLATSGSPNKALVLRKGSDAELASSIETKTVGVILAASGVKHGADGAPLGAGEVVVVIAQDKLGVADQVANVQVRGTTESSFSMRPSVRIVAGRPPKPGTDEAVVGQGLRGRFKGLDLGQSFDLKKNRPIQVVGIMESGGSSLESEVWVDLETLRTSFGREGLVSSVTVELESPTKYDAFAAAIENDKQLGLEALREREYYERAAEGTTLFVKAIGIVVAFFFSIGAMIGAMITMYAAVSQRSREIGTLRALGFSRFAILLSFLLESMLLTLLGGAVGAAASMLMGLAKFRMMNFSTWQEITFSFDPTPGILFGSLLAGGLMGILGGFFPAIRAARTSPVTAMRG